MKSNIVAMALAGCLWGNGAQAQLRDTLRVFDGVTFYDGYQETVVERDVDDGVLRHSNSLYAVRMTAEQLDAVGDSLTMDITVRACCDNYDRIGNVNLALVPKGADTYRAEDVTRIELGRFITPFMDKNRQPDAVSYRYDAAYLAYILRDRELRRKYDLWMELSLFGVPYAAQKQVAGCEGQITTFEATLDFVYRPVRRTKLANNVLVPVTCKKLGSYGANLNNYDSLATDTLGKTVRTWTFHVPRTVADGQIVLITSNHGANAGGEEYNRRWHYVYVDGELITSYIPGRPTCEPFRRFNTQANGIYGRSPKPDYAWQSFSNWCPGDKIDNRILQLGRVKAGRHTLTVSVPEAQFVEKQGDIPVSAFFQGLVKGRLPEVGMPQRTADTLATVRQEGDRLCADVGDNGLLSMELCAADGRRLLQSDYLIPVELTHFPSGTYLLNLYFVDGRVETHRIEKN
ncbi:MAG: hypothetical protein NC388_10180 [Clostridium sp.]|nr:hypothetical protein [Clostridium sp.]